MESNRQPAVAAAAVSKVLDNEDLFIEILLRVGFPTALVRAALVCKSWLGHVSNRAFLRHFGELHPPRLLGFYIKDRALDTDSLPFVPMLPQAPEFASVIRYARFGLEAYNIPRLHIDECWNGSVFVHWYDYEGNIFGGVHSPLCPHIGLTILPSLPSRVLEYNRFCIVSQVFSQKDRDDLSYFWLHMESILDAQEPKFCVKVYMLQDGCWHEMFHAFDMSQLPRPRWKPKSVLVDNKIYLPAELSDIIVLDLTASSLSIIPLPRGVDHRRIGATMLSRANDASGVYLIQAKEFQLRIWLHRRNNWMQVDSICLREMCENLISGFTSEDEYTPLLMTQVVDHGEFVYLKMSGCVLQLDIKCRTLHKVYETKHGYLGDINPFMMIWPPKFPALKYDPSRNAT